MILANFFSAQEGPADRGCVTQISDDGRDKRVVGKTARPNGLAVDSGGVIWVAESKTPSLLRLALDGNGEAFVFPNDLCFGADGALYFTDSGGVIQEFAPNNQIRQDYWSVHNDGRVYRMDVETGAVTKLDSGIKFTNGVAFGPDNLLYVNEMLTGHISRHEANGGPRVLFGNVIRPDALPGWKRPDSMAFGQDGGRRGD